MHESSADSTPEIKIIYAINSDNYKVGEIMSRATKLGEAGKVTISLPKQHFDYLTYLATNSRLGIKRDEVAAHILIQELDERLEAGYPKVKMGKGPGSSPTT